MEKTIKTKKLTNYYLFTIFIILFLGLAINNIVYTKAVSCAGNWINPHWECVGIKCQKFNTCGYNSCSSDYSCGTPVPTTTTTTTTTTKPSTTTTTPGSEDKYKCKFSNGGYTCVKDSSGTYSSSNVCWAWCPPHWSCSKIPLGCYESTSGYLWKDSCENNCYYGYNCYPGFVCSYAFLGQYSTLSGCEACCSESGCGATTYYSCNPDPDNPRCVVDSKGSYSNWAYCQSNCKSSNGSGGTTTTTKPPSTTTTTKPSTTTTTLPETEPCWIYYFELPERAWVNQVITGKWSASDWCEDCDVICIPYPECVWKENNIGIWDEYKFKIKQSGTYTYTLTCYGQESVDQRQETTSVQVLNLPWWREIIPVLPKDL